jgi:phage gpG-like protein
MLGDQRSNFEAAGSVFGSPWPALAPGTLAKKTGSARPLVLTGALEKAATGSTGKVTRITKSGVTVGINARLFYARFHQAGAKGGSRKGEMPKRELVGITPATREKSLTLIQKYLVPR